MRQNKDDKMVRIPKEMYDSILEIIALYPQYGWKGPAEFVRDAVRRYLEEIKKRESLYREMTPKLPKRIVELLREAAGDRLAEHLRKELENIEFEDPKEYYSKVVSVLSKYIGRSASELLAKRILETMKEEIKYEEESNEWNTGL